MSARSTLGSSSLHSSVSCPSIGTHAAVAGSFGIRGRERVLSRILNGTRRSRGSANRWVITEETGLVFVLIPRGTFRMGAEPPQVGAGTEETPERVAGHERRGGVARRPGGDQGRGPTPFGERGPTPTLVQLTKILPTLRTGEMAEFVVVRDEEEQTLSAPVKIGVGLRTSIQGQISGWIATSLRSTR